MVQFKQYTVHTNISFLLLLAKPANMHAFSCKHIPVYMGPKPRMRVNNSWVYELGLTFQWLHQFFELLFLGISWQLAQNYIMNNNGNQYSILMNNTRNILLLYKSTNDNVKSSRTEMVTSFTYVLMYKMLQERCIMHSVECVLVISDVCAATLSKFHTIVSCPFSTRNLGRVSYYYGQCCVSNTCNMWFFKISCLHAIKLKWVQNKINTMHCSIKQTT